MNIFVRCKPFLVVDRFEYVLKHTTDENISILNGLDKFVSFCMENMEFAIFNNCAARVLNMTSDTLVKMRYDLEISPLSKTETIFWKFIKLAIL